VINQARGKTELSFQFSLQNILQNDCHRKKRSKSMQPKKKSRKTML